MRYLNKKSVLLISRWVFVSLFFIPIICLLTLHFYQVWSLDENSFSRYFFISVSFFFGVYVFALNLKFKDSFFKILSINVLVLVVLSLFFAIAYELSAQIGLWFEPNYKRLSLKAHPTLGWTETPNASFKNSSSEFYYDREFYTDVQINNLGFRDKIRKRDKINSKHLRAAVFGDSFIEALQVEFEDVATQILEKKLKKSYPENNFEVLNFGVNNFGVGQFYLTYKEYAQKFFPDIVFILIKEEQMVKTINPYTETHVGIGSTKQEKKDIVVRPIFVFDQLAKQLLFKSLTSQEFDLFEQAQKKYKDKNLHGKMQLKMGLEWQFLYFLKMLPRKFNSFKKSFLNFKKTDEVLPKRKNVVNLPHRVTVIDKSLDSTDVLKTNLLVLNLFNRLIKENGAKLVIIDYTQTYDKMNDMNNQLKEYCKLKDIDYIPLSQILMIVQNQGVQTNYPKNRHFNVIGNQILAQVMYDWIQDWIVGSKF